MDAKEIAEKNCAWCAKGLTSLPLDELRSFHVVTLDLNDYGQSSFAPCLKSRRKVIPECRCGNTECGECYSRMELVKAESAMIAYLRTQEPLGDGVLTPFERQEAMEAEGTWERSAQVIEQSHIAADAEIRRLQAEVKTARDEADLANDGAQFYNRRAADAIVLRNAAEAQLQIAQQELRQVAGQLVIARQDLSEADKEMDKLEQQLQATTAALEAARKDGERLRGALSKILIAPTGECRLCGFVDSQKGHIEYCEEVALSAPAAEPQAEHPDTARLNDVIARATAPNQGAIFYQRLTDNCWQYQERNEEGYLGVCGKGDSPRAAIDAARSAGDRDESHTQSTDQAK